MEMSRIVKLRSKNIIQIFADGYPFFIMFLAYIVGMTAGVLLLNKSEEIFSLAKASFEKFNLSRFDKNFTAILLSTFAEKLPAMLAVFACGTGMVGMALSPIVVGYCGFCYGLLSGYIYLTYSFKGIIFVLIMIIPCSMISAFCLFFASRQAFRFSLSLANCILPNRRVENLYLRFTHYCKSFALLLLVSLCAALTDALISSAFHNTVRL